MTIIHTFKLNLALVKARPSTDLLAWFHSLLKKMYCVHVYMYVARDIQWHSGTSQEQCKYMYMYSI